MAQDLGMLAAFTEDWSMVPTTIVCRLKTACNSRSRGSNDLFWFLWHLHACLDIHRDNINKNKINSFKKK